MTEFHLLILLQDMESQELWGTALDTMKQIVIDSTSSMTAVPKPLKFLRPHYEKLKIIYDDWAVLYNSHDEVVSSFVSDSFED